MNKNWVVIFSSGNLQQAELVKGLLAHNEIHSVIFNHHDSFYKFGEFEIYVNRKDVVQAKYCLSQITSDREGFKSNS